MKEQSKLEATARIIDLGDRVIQLRHVVSVGWRASHPLRPAGIAAVVLGLGSLVSSGVALGRVPLDMPDALLFWLGLALAAIGLGLVVFVRRVVAIQTVDGKTVALPAPSAEMATAIILRIRHAMESVPLMGAGQVSEPMPAPLAQGGETAPSAQSAAFAATTAREATGASQTSGVSAPSTPGGDAMSSRTMPTGRHGAAYANGHATPSAFGPEAHAHAADAGSLKDQAVQAYRRAGIGGGTQPPQQDRVGGGERAVSSGEGTQALGATREPLALPATFPSGLAHDDGAHDLQALIQHVRRADVQHKEALLELLRVVEDNYRGRASREDAIAHWRSFADYVVQYLGDVEGLAAHTERFGRHMHGR